MLAGSRQRADDSAGQWTLDSCCVLLWLAARAVALTGSDPTEACTVVSDTLPGVSCGQAVAGQRRSATSVPWWTPAQRPQCATGCIEQSQFGAMGGLAVQGGRLSRPRRTPRLHLQHWWLNFTPAQLHHSQPTIASTTRRRRPIAYHADPGLHIRHT